MTDQPSAPGGEAAKPPPRPTWVKVLLAAVAVVLLVFVVLKLLGVEHGPSRHGSSALVPSSPMVVAASSETGAPWR